MNPRHLSGLSGGVAPTEACNAERVGVTARIPYTADYRLFTQR